MWGRGVGAVLAVAALLGVACGSDDDGGGEVSLAEAAQDVPADGGFELSIRLGPQEGDQAAFEGGGFTAEGTWRDDAVAFSGGLDLAPTGAELTAAEEQAYRSELEARLVEETLFLRSAAFGEEFVSADTSAVEPGTVVAPVVVVDGSGVWQPVELLPLLADATDVTEVDRLDLGDGVVATRLRAEVTGDLSMARAAVGLDADGNDQALVDAFVDEDGSIVRLEADVDAGFLIAHVLGPDASAPARLLVDFVDPEDGDIEAPDGARDVTGALS